MPPSNTTIIQRPTAESRTSGQVTLAALLTDDAQVIDQGVVWRIYRDKLGADGKPRLLSSHREASPLLKLDVGDYVVNVALGRANLTRKISVAAGKAVTEKFVLNAGGLMILAQLAAGEPTPENMVAVEIFADERDQSGSRISVMAGAKQAFERESVAGPMTRAETVVIQRGL